MYLSDLVMLAILCRKLSLVPKMEMQPKSLSYKDGSASWFTSYSMTVEVFGEGTMCLCVLPWEVT